MQNIIKTTKKLILVILYVGESI